MSSTLIEQARTHHHDLEHSIKSLVFEIQHKSKTQKRIVFQNHRINHQVEKMQKSAEELLNIYEDSNGFRRSEIESLTESTLQKTIAQFDTRLAEMREYHRNFPSNPMNRDAELPIFEQITKLQQELEEKIQFSGEESFGKYVDLHSLYMQYINLPHVDNSIDYLNYLNQFHMFHRIDQKTKEKASYRKYLQDLFDYLVDFHKRTQPLSDLTQITKSIIEQFESDWSNQKVQGWSKPSNEPEESNNTDQTKKKRKRRGKSNTNQDVNKSTALLERKIINFTKLLDDVIESTKIQIEKKQGRTWEEIENDLEREEQAEQKAEETELASMEAGDQYIEEEQEETEEDKMGAISNPLNLPMGWDGKPIPYWLYKLHGLGNEYKCEICGNQTYWGPRAFERHFQEWRHHNGMRCLRIPNTRHFHHITIIADALELWEKIKVQADEQTWKGDTMEEFEDKDGNVYNKKTFEDLKRQGIL
ncbi:splicing factor 3A subunit 3 [Acrasis kona]|uniref:Splicing factor 3A subunit 3 n=1 Tax=Acrasis kona TaxID=1008807 RepID=A0AAW2Z7H8_9EUKA